MITITDLDDMLLVDGESLDKHLSELKKQENTRQFIEKLGKKIRNCRNLVYLISVRGFYDNPTKALEIMSKATIPHSFDFRKFYEGQKEAYSRRLKYSTAHNPEMLRFELDFSSSQCKGTPAKGDDTSPSFENAVKIIEEQYSN